MVFSHNICGRRMVDSVMVNVKILCSYSRRSFDQEMDRFRKGEGGPNPDDKRPTVP